MGRRQETGWVACSTLDHCVSRLPILVPPSNSVSSIKLDCNVRRYVIVPLIKPDSSPAILFFVACLVTAASLFGMGAIKVRALVTQDDPGGSSIVLVRHAKTSPCCTSASFFYLPGFANPADESKTPVYAGQKHICFARDRPIPIRSQRKLKRRESCCVFGRIRIHGDVSVLCGNRWDTQIALQRGITQRVHVTNSIPEVTQEEHTSTVFLFSPPSFCGACLHLLVRVQPSRSLKTTVPWNF